MCLTNRVPERPFYGVSMAELASEVERLNWAAEIREKELDRLVYRERKIGILFSRMKRVIDSNALPEIKLAIVKAILERGPLFPK